MTTQAIFSRIVAALDAAGIAHMLTGSFASAFHGSPRATQDIDFVIEADEREVRVLVALLPRDKYYVDVDTAVEAVRTEGQFNVVDLETGWKVDLILRKSRAFSREEFSRRQLAELEGTTLAIASVEDLLIAKMEWSKAGGSLRQIEDAAAILRIREDSLDRLRIERWVAELGLDEQWRAAQAMART